MKKIFVSTLLISAAVALQAQTGDLGNQQLYYKRFQTAENTFHKVLQQDPNNAGNWYSLIKTYLLEDKLAKAADTIQYVPANIKSDPYLKVAMGSIALQEGKKDEANNYFNEAIKDTREKNAGVLSAVAESNIIAKNGDANFAIDALNKAIKRDKKNAALYVLLGDAYRNLQNGSEAFKAYQKAIDLNDKEADAYYDLGQIFLSQKNTELYLENFNKAIGADPNYAPALYQLYVYEFYHDPVKAMDYYKKYMNNSDASIQNQYDLADLLYISKQYPQAVEKANEIVKEEGDKAQPRLYKLIGYSLAAQKDTARAIGFMQQYFEKAPDSIFIAKDYITMGQLYSSMPQQDSLAMVYFEKAVTVEKDSSQLINDYKRLAELSAASKNYSAQAKWLGKYYTANSEATNLELFNWALAHFRAEEYAQADSVFGLYVAKYPDQSFGYYWQAKAKALQDKEMKDGLAVPAYEKLVEVLQKNPSDPNYKKWLVESYGYLAAYEVNTKKDYAEAVDYFEKVLQVDPDNADAKKYISVLQKNNTNSTDSGSK